MHLHFQQHHRELRATGFGAAGAFTRPEHTIKPVVQLLLLRRSLRLELWSFKPIEAIAGILGLETHAEGTAGRIRQERADQVWGALKDAVIPAVGVQTVLGAG